MAKHPIRKSWLYRKLVSVSIFTYLMLLLVFAMLLGTMFPQGRSPARYIKAWGIERYIKLATFNLVDIFHGWWFYILAFTFFLVILLCALERFLIWNTLLGKKIPISKRRIEALSFQKEELLAVKSQKLVEKLAEFCSQNGFKLKTGLRNNTLVATKGYNYTLVSVLYHLGIFLCLIGFVISLFFNFEDDFFLAPQESQTISWANKDTRWVKMKKRLGYEVSEVKPNPTNSFEVKLESFLSEYSYQEGRYWPKDWFSELVVYEGLAQKDRKRVEVNDPLRYRGIVFYQMAYDKNATLEVLDESGALEKEIVAGAYGRFEVPGIEGNFSLRDIRNGLVFYPNRPEEKIGPEFDLTYHPPKKTEDTTSAAAEAKAAEKEKTEAEPAPPPPPEKMGVLKLNQATIIKGKTVYFKSYEEKSGISYRFDPGIYLLWPAGILVVIGMMLRVYLPYYRILLIVDPINVERTLISAGLISKGLMASPQKTLHKLFNSLHN